MDNNPSITSSDDQLLLVKIFGLAILVSIFAGIYTGIYLLFGLPAFLLVVYICLVDFEKIFFLLIICIPFSIEYALPGGFATDLPTEPLMVGLMMIYLVYVTGQGRKMDASFLTHPVSMLLLLHICWIFTTTITSSNLLVSVKFSLAKIWYVVVFFLYGRYFVKKGTIDQIVYLVPVYSARGHYIYCPLPACTNRVFLPKSE